MKELKDKATKLGLDFRGNISKIELTTLVEAKESQIASDSINNEVEVVLNENETNKEDIEMKKTVIEPEIVEEEVKHIAPENTKKIKVIINPRDGEELEGVVRLNTYTAQYQFDEEIEMPEGIVEFLKSKGGNVYVGNGKFKWQSRYVIEKV